MTTTTNINHFHMFFGCGGGASGFNDARPEIPGLVGKMTCIGGMDVDPAGAEDFYQFTGVRGTVRDLFDHSQYEAFHGCEPPDGWQEVMPQDVRNAANGQHPHVVFLSAPCKGFSGLLSQTRSLTDKYQALNRLTLRGVWLMLEAWVDDPVEIILFENVPRIATRGRHLLDQITSMLRHYGYIVRETTHDCGELGGLAESRKRFLLVARHAEKVPACLYEPPKRPLRAVGEILDRMHLPGDLAAGPMHRIPNLAWKTWVRLAFVEAGKDWRSLNRLVVENGHLRDYLIVPAAHHGYLGVHEWEESVGAVTSRGLPTNGAFSIADPRAPDGSLQYSQYGVQRWEDTCGAVISGSTTGQGAFAVADPRPNMRRGKGDNYLTAGHYGVTPWTSPTGAVSASGNYDNGPWSVADPRLPEANDKLVTIIRSMDGTWHRPFTTLELAAIQSLYDPDDYEAGKPFQMFGNSDSAWRERIGNAVPRRAACAIATEIGRTILLSMTGETFQLSSTAIWVRPMTIALSVRGNE